MKAVFVTLFALVAVASCGIVRNAYSELLDYPHAQPYATSGVVSPGMQSGYVAATRGSIHTAPLPEGPYAFVHHINTAPAPGTF